MPSVRVKRDRARQYTTLQDVYAPDDVSRRPRSHSVAAESPSCEPVRASFAELPANSPQTRRRSYTVTGGTVDSRQSQRLPRAPSRIYDHIMRDEAPRPRKDSTATGGRREQQSGHEDSDVISLQGSTENIMYRGSGHHTGRIGSALGGPDFGSEDTHHHDDIVEYLDVIGTFFMPPS